jgi:hypothetical protein
MRKRHLGTLRAIFEEPTRANIAWSAIMSLMLTLGAEITEGRGSRVRVYMNGRKAVFHRPHRKETSKAAVESVRNYLNNAGVNDDIQ